VTPEQSRPLKRLGGAGGNGANTDVQTSQVLQGDFLRSKPR